MIVRPRPTLLQLLYVMRSCIIPRILALILSVALFSALLVALHGFQEALIPIYAGAAFALIGIALSIFLSFRNSACYDR